MWSLQDSEKESLANASERALVREAQKGSERAVEALFRRHWPSTHRAAFLVVRDAAAAEDIVQDAFLAALGALDRFDRRRPFGPWLHRIAINRAIDWTRARKLRREVAATDGLLDSVRSDPGVDLGDSEAELGPLLARLSPDPRAAPRSVPGVFSMPPGQRRPPPRRRAVASPDAASSWPPWER